MNVNVSTAIDLVTLQSDATQSQATILNLVDREKEIQARLADLVAQDDDDRRDGTAEIILECEGLVAIHKSLKDQINRVQKRIENLAYEVKADLQKEVLKVAGAEGTIETENFQLKHKFNPPSVVVDELKDVPKRYRNEPAPIPPFKKWPANKALIKNDLTKQKVKGIKGVHLERGEKLDIKRV